MSSAGCKVTSSQVKWRCLVAIDISVGLVLHCPSVTGSVASGGELLLLPPYSKCLPLTVLWIEVMNMTGLSWCVPSLNGPHCIYNWLWGEFPFRSLFSSLAPVPLKVGRLPLPSLHALEVGSPLRLGILRERISFPSGSGQSPATKHILVHFRHKFAPFYYLMMNNLLCLLSIKRKFPWYICNSYSPPKNGRLWAHKLAAVYQTDEVTDGTGRFIDAGSHYPAWIIKATFCLKRGS